MLIRHSTRVLTPHFTNRNVFSLTPHWTLSRSIFSITGVVDQHLSADTLHNVEQHWKPRLQSCLPVPSTEAPKYYVLSMFPYPSGKLHMGHVRVYSISDTFAHYYRMLGYNVIHPMGWDAFGLPAENAAIENGASPAVWTKDNIAKMKDQLMELGCTFDWDRELATCDPEYYRWTQYLFLKLYEEGLVYQNESMVNWDPVDQTVLADEQVDGDGRSWRSGALVEKKPLKQWFFKTTQFSQSLLEGLEDPSLINWRAVVKAQKNWIGDCCGTNLDFRLMVDGEEVQQKLTVWTDQPEFVHGAEFIVLHPEHLVSTVYTGARLEAVNPFTGSSIPVIVSEDVEYNYGAQTILAFPSVSETHRAMATQFNMTPTSHITSISSGQVTLANCGPLSGLSLPSARTAVLDQARKEGIGGHHTSSNLKDWLISRQRYWGTPIPVVHCSACGPVPVPADQLPVPLPPLSGDQLASKGPSPLLQCEDWLATSCPQCGGEARRETDTMDTFVDSSWYFLRYLDSKNKTEPFSTEAVKNMPVDLYIGGLEHAYLHLYFARFFTHFLHSIGMSPVKEPFCNLITQGMVKGRSYRLRGSTKYLKPDQVYEDGGKFYEIDTKAPVVTEWEKMSKSKHNGVDPGSMFELYGCDTVRLMMLSNVGPGSDRNWSEESYPGIRNMQIKLWKLVHQAVDLQEKTLPEMRYDEEMQEYRDKLRLARNTHLRHVNYNYSHTRNLAVVIARVNSMIAAAWGVPGQVKRDAPEYQQLVGNILITLAPIAPHMVAELWESFRSVRNQLCPDFDWNNGVFHQAWPQLDQTFNLELKVVANKKELAKIPVVKWYFDSLTEEQAFDLSCHDNQIQEQVLPFDISARNFNKVDGFEAVLELFYVKPEGAKKMLSEEEFLKKKKAEKETKKQEKLAKKAAREERIRIYNENVARKEKFTKTIPKYPE